MNKKLLIAPLLAISLIAPVAAFAHDDNENEDATTNTEHTVSVYDRLKTRIGLKGDAEGEMHTKDGMRAQGELHASSTMREKDDQDQNDGSDEDTNEQENDSNTSDHHDKVEAHAGNAIDARIDSLTKLSARIANSKFLSASLISSIQASLASEVDALIALKAKIGTDTATTTLKDDVKSITKDVRVYLLVEPKARIAAAAGRINAVVTQFGLFSTKLQTRIDAAATAGTNVDAARAALTDLNAKVADAKVQADAAVSLTANLSADGGDKVVLKASLNALKSAREKLTAAEADLRAARKDAWEIIKSVKGVGVTASSTTSVETH